MGLKRYWQKRDFDKTSEPRGRPQPKTGFTYVIQKHAASHLHYDFRLELAGVLLSWAVPKTAIKAVARPSARQAKAARKPAKAPRKPARAVRKPAKAKPRGKGAKAGDAEPRPEFRLTNPDRVLYPEDRITKSELAEYYAAVHQWILPHVANRPLTLVRCPEGYDKECFFQKHANDRLAPGIRPIPIADKDGPTEYTAIDDVVGLLGLVQMGVLEIHTWGAHADDPERPDLLVLDLDPDPAVSWQEVVRAAKLVRDRLTEIGLRSFVKTTGGKGLHVCFPISRRTSWNEAKEFCRSFTEQIVAADPLRYVANMSKAKRKGKIFIDFFRNGRGATFIAPYSSRARRGAPVATPLDWDELSVKLDPRAFSIRSVPSRLASLKLDPWSAVNETRQALTRALLRDFGVIGVK